MALSSLFFAAGAIIKGAFLVAKGAFVAASKSVFSKFIYGGLMVATGAMASRTSFKSAVSASPTYQGSLCTQTNPDLPLPIIYGTVKTAGNLIWQNSQEAFSQKIIAFSEGEITEFTDIRINDIPVEKIKDVQIEKFFGTDDQLIASVAPGSSQYDKTQNVGSLKNVAYLALTVFNDEKISSNYNLTVIIKGKKVRVYTSENEYIFKYSENPAWILLDFLTAYNGLGLGLDENSRPNDFLISKIFDIQSFIEAANYCDVIVNGVKRFTFNMIFDSQTTVRSLLDEIYRSCRGGLFVKNGQLQFKIDKDEHISKVFTSDDISNEIFKTVPSEELYDILKIVYISPAHEWQKVEAFAEIPEYRNGAPVENSVSVFSCTNFEQASRLAWYYSNSKVLQPYYGSFDTDYRAYDLEVGDVIAFDSSLMGLTAYKVKVTQITDDGAGTYTVSWQTYDERLYADLKGSLEPRLLVTKLNDLYKYPDDVKNFNVIQNQNNFNFVWQLNENLLDTYEIRVGTSWDDGKIVASGIKGNSFFWQINGKGLFFFWIKAFNNYNYSKNPTCDVLMIQDIPQMNVIVDWDLIGDDSLFLPMMTDNMRTFEKCYIYHHILKPLPVNQWINPLQKAVSSGQKNDFAIIQYDDYPDEYLQLEYDYLNNSQKEVLISSSENYYIIGNPSITNEGLAESFSQSDYIIVNVSFINTSDFTINGSFTTGEDVKSSQFIFFARFVNEFGYTMQISNNSIYLYYPSGDSIAWVKGSCSILPDTKYFYELIFSQDSLIWKCGISEKELIIMPNILKYSFKPFKLFKLGMHLSQDVPFKGTIDLRDFAVHYGDNSIFKLCTKIFCKHSNSGKYIADVKYREDVKNIYELNGITNIYTIDTVNKNFTRAGSMYSNFLWGNWEDKYLPPYITNNGRWGTETSVENIFTSRIFDIGKKLECSISLELDTDSADSVFNDVLAFWRYSADGINWSDFAIFNHGTYTFRYAQFKLRLNCRKNQYICVNTAKVSVDVPDKDASYQIYISNPEQGYYLDYSEMHFVVIPSIVATVTDNIYAYAITAEKTSLGARIFAVTNDGQKTNATIDIQIKGY